MPEHLRALVVIVAVAIAVFALAAKPVRATGMSPEDYRSFRNLWFAVTLAAFLAHSFWLYCALCLLILATQTARRLPVVSVYFMLLFAVPPLRVAIPGIGPIDHLFEVDHYRLLNIGLLLPAAISLWSTRDQKNAHFPRWIDRFVVLFLLWMFFIQAMNDSITGTIRAGFYLIIDFWLPYFVVSRSLRTFDDFRSAAAVLVVSTVIVGLIALFEWARFWLLYDGLRAALNIPTGFPMYLLRGESLRANVSLGNAIVLGFVLMVGLGMLLMLFDRLQPSWRRWVAAAALVAGFVGSLSRGPWLGAAFLLACFLAIGPGRGKRLALSIVAGAFATFAVLVTPLRGIVLPYLPFIGTVETGSVDYRQRLFDVSIEVWALNPWLGDFWYTQNPLMEQMRQGQGIIDMVNTYLQIALPYGIVGLSLFVGPFILGIFLLNAQRRRMATISLDHERVGRALLATCLGAMLTIATVSNIGIIASLLWILLGSMAAYINTCRQIETTAAEPRSAPPRRQAARASGKAAVTTTAPQVRNALRRR